MKKRRTAVPEQIATELAIKCRRRCCLCYYLEKKDKVAKGQVAHLNRNPDDNRIDNLVWLCLEHHDEYDSRPSQSKGLMSGEVRHYRDQIYSLNIANGRKSSPGSDVEVQIAPGASKAGSSSRGTYARSWRFPLWQAKDRLELFAYIVVGGMDGVCLIERVPLPDGRVVVVCAEAPGNPGRSITNSVEEIAEQVCDRFEIPADQLVWLEYYPTDSVHDWRRVEFRVKPPTERLGDPEWIEMDSDDWDLLRLRPKSRFHMRAPNFPSMLIKKFKRPLSPTE